jgi:hypothetical protein
MLLVLLSHCSGAVDIDLPDQKIPLSVTTSKLVVKANKNSIVIFNMNNDSMTIPIDTILKYYYHQKKIKSHANH